VNWVELLRNFYTPFNQKLEQAQTQMRNVKAEIVPTEHVCDKCGSPMVVRWGRNGKFLACSGYPACKNTKPIIEDESGAIKIVEQEKTDKICQNCGKPMAVKSGRRGKFLACTGYPGCKTTMPYAIGINCPRCKTGELVERRTGRGLTFYSCNNYPECKFSLFERPYQAECETCHTQHYFVGQGPKKRYVAGERLPDCPYERVTFIPGIFHRRDKTENRRVSQRSQNKSRSS
jgi:DNA topoisomerase I